MTKLATTRAILEGRWRKLQEAMAGADLDALVVAGRGVIAHFGYVFYVCGYTPMIRVSYGLLPREGEPILFVPSHSDQELVRERGLVVDVRSTGEADAVRSETPMALAVAQEVRTGAPRRVGVVGLGQIVPVADYLVLQRELPGVELVDATGLAAGVKARKDAWEVEQVRAAFRLAGLAYAAAPPLLRPRARAQEVVAELERILRANGATELLVFVESSLHFARRTTDTVLRPGDLVTVLVEVANEDGFWVELGGLFALGEPPARARALASACYRALERIRDIVAPGVPVTATTAVLEEIAGAEGLRLSLGLGHGIGVDHDLPSLYRADPSLFEEGQVVSVHPTYEDHEAGLGAVVADALLVTAGGCEQLSGLRYELTILSNEGGRG